MTSSYGRGAAIVAITALAACGGPEVRQDTEHPVRWSTAMQLDSLPVIDARLAAPFTDTVEVFHYATPEDLRLDRNAERARVTDCVTYLDLTDRGFAPRSDLSLRGLQRIGAGCRGLAALKSATPSRVSHLSGFVLDEPSLALLPPG